MIKLGGISVNKLYAGDSEVKKMYLGSDLVFDNIATLQIPTGITLWEVGVFSIISYNISEETDTTARVQVYMTEQCSINYYVNGVKNPASNDDFNAGNPEPGVYRHTRTLTELPPGQTSTLVIELTAQDDGQIIFLDDIPLTTTGSVTGTKPIMTNFRINTATPTHIHFDAPLGPVTGVDFNDFIIDGKTITAIDTLLGYITVSSPLNYYDNILIRKEGGNNTVVYDFALQYIENLIDEPQTVNEKFVEVGASGSGDSLGDPMSITAAFTQASANTTYWVKQGDYSSVNCTVGGSGTPDQPVKFIGYKTNPGDTPTLTRSVGMAFDSNEMPLLQNGSGAAIRNAQDYIFIRNFQLDNYAEYGINYSGAFFVTYDNIFVKECQWSIRTIDEDSTNNRVINSYVADSSQTGVEVQNNYNLIKNTWAVTSYASSMDYYLTHRGGEDGHSNCFIDCYINRFTGDSHSGHGISFRGDAYEANDSPSTLSLVQDCEIIGTKLELRNRMVYNNVFRNITITDGTGINLNDGANYNTLENVIVKNCDYFVNFYQTVENGGVNENANHNIFKNCIADDVPYIFTLGTYDTAEPVQTYIQYNEWLNCTFINSPSLWVPLAAENHVEIDNTNNFTNCIIEDIDSKGTGISDITYTYCDFWNSWAVESGTGNFSIDPQLDASYEPQATFSDIDVPRIDGVYYGKNGNERQDPTTVGSVLSAEEIAVDPPLYPQSPYTEVVNVPVYDSGNPAHKLIQSNADWSDINDPAITSFYVEPGDYLSAGVTDLTANGTSGAKRYISLHNGNDTHPGKIWPDTNSLVQARFSITGNYWVLDRMGNWTHTIWSDRTITINGGQNNIINRQFQDNNEAGMVYLFEGSHNNTIQNFRTQRDDWRLWADQAMIGITVSQSDNASVMNTKILNGECYNAVDAVQTIKTSPVDNLNSNFEGTIMDYNHFYIDNLIYSNGSGAQDINGKFAFAENAIDLKGGSTNPLNPLVITNNKMWGYRQSDETGTGLSDNGWAIVTHFDVANVVIDDNVMFDTNKAVGANAAGVETGLSMLDTSIKRNIIKDTLGSPLGMYSCDNIQIEDNLFVNTSYDTTDFYDWVWDNNNNGTYKNNIRSVIGCGTNTQNVNPANQDILDNTYWDYTDIRFATDVSDIIAPSDPTENYTDLVFTTDNYTNAPREITLTKVLKP